MACAMAAGLEDIKKAREHKTKSNENASWLEFHSETGASIAANGAPRPGKPFIDFSSTDSKISGIPLQP